MRYYNKTVYPKEIAENDPEFGVWVKKSIARNLIDAVLDNMAFDKSDDCINYPEFQDKIYAQFGQQIEKSCPVRLAMYDREAYRLSKEGVIGRALDEFFTNHAHEFGYKYFTNMPKD